jgi:hypothetical protein
MIGQSEQPANSELTAEAAEFFAEAAEEKHLCVLLQVPQRPLRLESLVVKLMSES